MASSAARRVAPITPRATRGATLQARCSVNCMTLVLPVAKAASQ
jgi:hypothetical protein